MNEEKNVTDTMVLQSGLILVYAFRFCRKVVPVPAAVKSSSSSSRSWTKSTSPLVITVLSPTVLIPRDNPEKMDSPSSSSYMAPSSRFSSSSTNSANVVAPELYDGEGAPPPRAS